MKFFITFGLIILVLYLLLIIALYFVQEKFIFFPSHLTQDFEFQYFENTAEVFLDIDAHTKIHALHFRVNQPKGIILYFHGNARSLDDWGFAAQDFTALGWEVLMPDYRTFGKSTGKLSEKALYADALRWYQHIQKNYSEQDIIIFGRSLGTGIATQLASINSPKHLILETPYLSLAHMVRLKMPFVPMQLLAYKFLSHRNIKKVNAPIDIIHGTQDALIPYGQAKKLASIMSEQTTFTTIEGGGHNDLSQFKEWKKRIGEILE